MFIFSGVWEGLHVQDNVASLALNRSCHSPGVPALFFEAVHHCLSRPQVPERAICAGVESNRAALSIITSPEPVGTPAGPGRRVISNCRNKGRKEGGGHRENCSMCCGSPLPPSPWVTATRLQVLRMAQFELQGGFAFGKYPSKALHSMKITGSLLGESWPLNSGLIKVEFQPFGPCGENPSGSWHCLRSNILLSHGQGLFLSLLGSPRTFHVPPLMEQDHPGDEQPG